MIRKLLLILTFLSSITVLADEEINWPPLPPGLEYALEQMDLSNSSAPPPPGEGEFGIGEFSTNSIAYGYTNGEFYLVIEIITNYVQLTAHNTEEGLYYQILKKNDLNELDWLYDREFYGATGATNTVIDPFPMPENPKTFYWAAHSDTVVSFDYFTEPVAYEPSTNDSYPGNDGILYVLRSGPTNTDLTVHFRLSGVASNGVDYVTNSTSSVTFSNGQTQAQITISPLEDNLIEFSELAVITLVRSNGYLLSNNIVRTVEIRDYYPTNLFTVVANLNHPIGVDYHSPTESLLVSYNWDTGSPSNFVRIDTNGTVTGWTDIHDLTDELNIATVKVTTNGFTAGQSFFGTGVPGRIASASSDGASWTNNWLTLSGETSLLRGGFYVDQSGSFRGDLIVVSGGANNQGGGVWRINSSRAATRLANITNNPYPHLEGVITLTNDVQKWGPWAGKIITGAESVIPRPLIYAIDTNGIVTTFDLGIVIAPEDFDLIPSDQDLYLVDDTHQQVQKLSRTLLTNYVGDLLITQEGVTGPPTLFIVRWDSTNEHFVVQSIPHNGHIERVAFAPIDIPEAPDL